MLAKDIKQHLQKLSDQKQAAILQRFFKTGPGEYGYGDIFLGIKIPVLRKLIPNYKDTSLSQIIKLLQSKIHEERMFALLLLVDSYQRTDQEQKEKIYNSYLKNTASINNWDLVDLSAPKIVGHYLYDKDKSILYHLCKSANLWEKRIAIIATFYFIKQHQFEDTLKIAQEFLNEKHDLMHKATGWMLREVGKQNLKAEEDFLKKHYRIMPRTMLRYAIEKFPEPKRQRYLKGKI